MSNSKNIHQSHDNPAGIMYGEAGTRSCFCLLLRNPASCSPTLPGDRRGRKKQVAEPGRLLGVRRRPWGWYAAEIQDPTTKERHWLATFDTAQEAALSMKGVQARTNFIYSLDHHGPLIDPSNQFSHNSVFFGAPFEQALAVPPPPPPPALSPAPPFNNNYQNAITRRSSDHQSRTTYQPDKSKAPEDSSHEDFFPFSRSDGSNSNSGYLNCIVPESCLKPPKTESSKSSQPANVINAHDESHFITFDLPSLGGSKSDQRDPMVGHGTAWSRDDHSITRMDSSGEPYDVIGRYNIYGGRYSHSGDYHSGSSSSSSSFSPSFSMSFSEADNYGYRLPF